MAKVLEGPGMGLMKKWGISVPQYVVVSSVDELKKLADGNNWLSKDTLVVKAHEALGSRFKLGLVKVDLDLRGAQAAAKEMLGRQVGSITVTQVIVSEMVPHKEEYYAAVKSLRPETLCDDDNRLVDETVPQSQPKKSGFVRRYSTKPRQFLS